jgi:hypothetical protein
MRSILVLFSAAVTISLVSATFGLIPEKLRESSCSSLEDVRSSHHKHHKEHGKHSKHHKKHEKKHDRENRMQRESSEKSGTEFEIELNKDRLMDVIRDFEEFGVTYWDKTEDDRDVVIEALKDAWTNTAGKLILNFGKSVSPVAEEWATIM